MATVKCENYKEFIDLFGLFYENGYAIGNRRRELTLLVEK